MVVQRAYRVHARRLTFARLAKTVDRPQMLTDLLILKTVPIILFTAISYYMVGFVDSASHFFMFLFGMLLFNWTGTSWAKLNYTPQ